VGIGIVFNTSPACKSARNICPPPPPETVTSAVTSLSPLNTISPSRSPVKVILLSFKLPAEPVILIGTSSVPKAVNIFSFVILIIPEARVILLPIPTTPFRSAATVGNVKTSSGAPPFETAV
jgi:hypothetical protein